MNMTSNETAAESQEITPETTAHPAMTPEQFREFQKRLAAMQKNPEFLRMLQNRQRQQAEFNDLVAMPADKRCKLFFTVQCHLMTKWHAQAEKTRSEWDRQDRETSMAN